MRSTGNFNPEWGYLAPAPSMLRTVRVVLAATAIGATAGAGVVLSLVDRPTGDAARVAVAAHAIVTSAQAAPAMESSKVSAMPMVAPAAVAPATAASAAGLATTNPISSAHANPANMSVSAKVTAPESAPLVQAPQAQAAAQPDNSAPQPITPPQTAVAAPKNDAGATATTSHPAVAALSDAPAASATQAVTSDASDSTDEGMGFVGPQQPPKKKHHNASGYKDGFPDIGRTLRHLFSARNTGTAYYPNRAY